MRKRHGMQKRYGWWAGPVVIALSISLAGCSDDELTGPQFGELEFRPGFVPLGLARETSAVLANEGSTALGPILIRAALGIGIGEIQGQVCPDMETRLSPGSVASLAPGASSEVQIVVDMSAVDLADCPEGSYDIDITASVSGLGLAATTVRIDWIGQN
ncbi:MAG: hypothetical protein P8125_02010 [Gemmatimonadota bacterium]|jgi:hypothetical protein